MNALTWCSESVLLLTPSFRSTRYQRTSLDGGQAYDCQERGDAQTEPQRICFRTLAFRNLRRYGTYMNHLVNRDWYEPLSQKHRMGQDGLIIPYLRPRTVTHCLPYAFNYRGAFSLTLPLLPHTESPHYNIPLSQRHSIVISNFYICQILLASSSYLVYLQAGLTPGYGTVQVGE